MTIDVRDSYYTDRLQQLRLDDQRAGFAERELRTIEILGAILDVQIFSPGQALLDLGCGDQFLRAGAEARGQVYTGLDIRDCDFEKDTLPIAGESIDIALAYSVIEHLRDPSVYLSECVRVLKPGGFLILEAPNWHFSYRGFFDDFTHLRPYSPQSLCGLLRSFKFDPLLDVPNLRCRSKFAYTNRYRYRLAALRPFCSSSRFLPGFLTGRALGMIVVAQKPR